MPRRSPRRCSSSSGRSASRCARATARRRTPRWARSRRPTTCASARSGKPSPGTEVRIADDGEILTRGPATFLGYFKDPDATAETIDADGWLHTGDVGELDADGFLKITDRKKDIIITAGGKNVCPSEIENKLKVSPFVREAVVIGDQRRHLSALIGIELDTVGNWALHRRIGFTTYADLSSKHEVVALIGDWVDAVNADLAQVETIKRFTLLPKELDQEDGEVTATQKVKRQRDRDGVRAADRGDVPVTAALLADITSTDLMRTLVSGLALGCKYALVALGFVIVFKATGVINFAQASFVLVGGYMTFNAANTWNLNFYLALGVAMAAGAILGMLIEALILRRMIGEAPFTLVMVTIGILFILDNLVTAIWGPDPQNLGDPWTTVRTFGDVPVADKDLWTIGFTALVLAGFFLFFRYSTLGLAMRATALDQEAAMAQGISARKIYRVSWGIAGLVAALAGAALSAGSVALHPGVGLIALVAFPAMILGGLDSPLGAVVGGIIIGLVQQLTSLYGPEYLEWFGNGFELVSPYLVMIVILLVRPYGIFGTKEVRRV